MMTQDLDAIITEGFDKPQPEPVEPVEDVVESETEPTESSEEAWPKGAVNAHSKAKQKALKFKQKSERLEMQLNAERSELERLRKQVITPANDEPQEKDFANYHDYIRAVNKKDNEKLLDQRDAKLQETQKAAREQAWIQERETNLETAAQAFLKEIPDARLVLEENADTIDELPPEIQRLFLEADNAPLAFYNLAKEGKLESLAAMSHAKAAMLIGRAQAQVLPKKSLTNAPTPMAPSRGTGTGAKQPQTAEEILKWINS